MSVSFCGIELEHAFINASGTWDPIAAHKAFGQAAFDEFPFSAHVTKTITVQPRQGNSAPRIWELPAGMINSIGLPNKGIDRWLAEDLPQLAALPVPLIVNVMGFSTTELELLVARVSGETPAVAIELNVSCPNVETGTIVGSDPVECFRVVDAVRPLTDLPLIVKLTPNATDPAAVAVAAVEAGADSISLINTLRGVAFDPVTGNRWLGGGTGGVSGPGVKAIALAQIASVNEAIDAPIVGIGGVTNGRDAADMVRAGADLVAIGTASFRDPRAANAIRSEYSKIL